MAGRVGPVQGAVIRAPGQAVGGGGGQHGLIELALDLRRGARAAVQAIERGIARHPGLVQRANPEAPQRVTLAVIGAQVLRVVVERGDVLQRPTPCAGAKHAMAQRNHQAAAGRGRDAAGLAGHGPGLNRAQTGLGAQDFPARNIDPVQPLFVRVPKRRFAQEAGLRGDGLPAHSPGVSWWVLRMTIVPCCAGRIGWTPRISQRVCSTKPESCRYDN